MSRGLPFLSSRRRSVLSRAVARWRAGNYNATLDALVDESGNGLHARLGSAVGADTNDPLRLSYAGEKYFYLPGDTSNYLSRTMNVSGSFTVTIEAQFADWSSATIYFPSHASGSTGWQFCIAAGTIEFRVGNGSSFTTFAATVLPGLAANSRHTLAAVYTDNTSLVFELDGVQLGDLVPVAVTLANSGTTLKVGENGRGRIYRFQITGLADARAAAAVEPYATLADNVSGTWTLNRSTTGEKLSVVDRDLILLDGVDNYLEVADSPLLDWNGNADLTFAVVFRTYAGTGSKEFYNKRTASDGVTPYFNYAANTIQGDMIPVGGVNYAVLAQAITYGTAGLHAMVGGYNWAASYYRSTYTPKVVASGPLYNGNPLYFGRPGAGSGAGYNSYEFIGAAVFRAPLTAAECRRLALEMGVAS